jgi:2-methylisocitrate lyase-like PEP mutase family enzyme
MTNTQKDTAAAFRALHAPGQLLLLPNAWDAASARIAEECGAKAIATSSAAVAWAHGYPDGEKIPKDTLLAMVREIVRVTKHPVTADSESGYSANPDEVADFVVALAKAGAVGINLEDGTDLPTVAVAKLKAIKAAVAREGFDIFVNVRTDVYLKSLVPANSALEETLARGRLYRDAGADGFFVPAVVDTGAMRKIADEIALPLNVLVWKGLAPAAALKDAGVRRVSAGAGISRAAYGAARRAMAEILDVGRYDAMFADAENCPNLNALMENA